MKEFISSDTNIWIDFITLNCLDLPFMLSYTYIMCRDAVEDEILQPSGSKDCLLKAGLVPIDFTETDFWLAESYGTKYPKLSKYDRLALAIAKERNITLLTGDKALRNASKTENVALIGTLGILDKLFEAKFITQSKYLNILYDIRTLNGMKIRLPKEEIDARIEKFTRN